MTTTLNTDLVIFILGTTGVGKSKLAIELAKKYNGEIISSDSMQLYKGADVITNKVTDEEMEGIPHHMMSLLDLNQLSYNVGNFISTVIPIIKDIQTRGKLPIIVGGTHYYTTSILWSNTLVSYDEQEQDEKEENTSTTTTTTTDNNNNSDGSVAERVYSYEKLKEVDELMARKLHSNDSRKIKRSLDIYYDTGRKHSDIVLEQKNSRVQRYRSCLIWLDCSNDVLEKRLNDRVDVMVDKGMIQECFDIFNCEQLINSDSTENFTKGLTQAIGVKEFYPYYLLKSKNQQDNNNNNLKPENEKEKEQLKQCIEQTKLRTRQYASKQKKWVKKLSQDQLVMHRLDTSKLEHWNQDVSVKAEEIVNNYFEGKENDIYQKQQQQHDGGDEKNGNNKRQMNGSLDEWEKHYCQVCDNREINGIVQWRNHLKSKQHHRRERRAASMEQRLNKNNNNNDNNDKSNENSNTKDSLETINK